MHLLGELLAYDSVLGDPFAFHFCATLPKFVLAGSACANVPLEVEPPFA